MENINVTIIQIFETLYQVTLALPSLYYGTTTIPFKGSDVSLNTVICMVVTSAVAV